MKKLFVCSSEPQSGKTAICLGMALNLMKKGKRVGYMKPIGNRIVDVNGRLTDDDAWKVKNILCLEEPSEILSPVLLTDRLVENVLKGTGKNPRNEIRKAFRKISEKRDVVILEGTGEVSAGMMLGLSDPDVAKLVGAKILLISKYESEHAIDRVLRDVRIIGSRKRIAGVVLVDVPKDGMQNVKKLVVPFLEKKGVRVIGVLPEDSILKSISVEEIAEIINAKILTCRDKPDTLVGSFIIGAMGPQNALKYFRRLTDKAVITGGDRSDILLTALETETKCLILTGNLHPSVRVLSRAEEKKVPVLLTNYDTLTAVGKLEAVMNRIGAPRGRKLNRMEERVARYINLEKLLRLC